MTERNAKARARAKANTWSLRYALRASVEMMEFVVGEADSSAARRKDNQKSECNCNDSDNCNGAGWLGGGAEEEIGAGYGEEEVGGPGGEDGGEGVDVAEVFEDAGDDPITDGYTDGGTYARDAATLAGEE
jgi:hypothetical protein